MVKYRPTAKELIEVLEVIGFKHDAVGYPDYEWRCKVCGRFIFYPPYIEEHARYGTCVRYLTEQVGFNPYHNHQFEWLVAFTAEGRKMPRWLEG